MRDILFRIASSVRHVLTSRHTMGYGVHSPHLFYIARVLVPERSPYYCFDKVEALRQRLLRRQDKVMVTDFGTGQSGERRVCDIARRSLKDRRSAQFLFRLANFSGAERIVELGTCLGVTTAYLALPHPEAEVITFEGSETLAKIAKEGWKSLGVKNIEQITGNIDNTLPQWVAAEAKEPVDLIFIDANHTGEALLRYFQALLPVMSEQTVIVVDDIRYSRSMYEGWMNIVNHEQVTATMDMGEMGLVFMNRHWAKQTYKIRF